MPWIILDKCFIKVIACLIHATVRGALKHQSKHVVQVTWGHLSIFRSRLDDLVTHLSITEGRQKFFRGGHQQRRQNLKCMQTSARCPCATVHVSKERGETQGLHRRDLLYQLVQIVHEQVDFGKQDVESLRESPQWQGEDLAVEREREREREPVWWSSTALRQLVN